ncbi:MAG: death-on-curing protein [Porphyromonadaceae bacterium CG2_30_38_12]|nr:MAG: death-on-curing protein [Porphyromonadaceae bacterium CG2_30_38_12]
MNNQIEIYKTSDNQTEISVQFDTDTVWLTQNQISELFEKDRTVITKHIRNIFNAGELDTKVVSAKFALTTQHGAIEGKTQTKEVVYYNLDVIISVGYRVNSVRGSQFRQWATKRLKDYLVQGYAINEKRLAQKQQEVEYLKTGIRILNRSIEQQATSEDNSVLTVFAKGLSLLDAYDHQKLDNKGLTICETIYPTFEDYMRLIQSMYYSNQSDVFAKPKDDTFNSSINQISQCFDGLELYPTLEEKAANLLYFITKNHSFVDGNKRIAAACFVYFMEKNNAVDNSNGNRIISNEALAALTLFIATSKTEESEIVKQFIISILNQSK